MKTTLRRSKQQAPAARWKLQRVDALLVVPALVAGVLIVRELGQEEVGSEGVRAPTAQVLTAWAAQPGVQSGGGSADVPATGEEDARPALPHDDNSSQIDGAPPVPVETAGAWAPPMQPGPPLAPEHMPEVPAQARPASGPPDSASLRYRLETLLTADPEALQQARAMLDESDPDVRAHNLEILADSFGLE